MFTKSFLLHIPPEVFAQICSFLSANDIRNLLTTCRSLHIFWPSENSAFWNVVAASRVALPNFPCSRRRAVALGDAALSRLCTVDGSNPFRPISPPRPSSVFGYHSASSALAVASHDGIRLWTGNAWAREPIICSADRRGSAVTAVAFDTAGRHLAVGGHDRAVVVFEVDEINSALVPGKYLRGHTGCVTCVSFCGIDSDVVVSGSTDTTIRLHHAVTRRGLGVLRGHGTTVSNVAAVREGRELLSWGPLGDGRAVKLWNVESTTCLSTVKFSNPIDAVAVDPHRDTAYCASGPSVRVIDLRAPNETAAILSLPRAWKSTSTIPVLSLRDDGLLAAGIGGGGVGVWDARGPWEARALGWPGLGGYRESKRIQSLALSREVAVIGCRNGHVSSLDLNGDYVGSVVVPKHGNSQSAVNGLWVNGRDESSWAIGRGDGSLELFDENSAKDLFDWNKAKEVINPGSTGKSSGFWVSL